MKHLVRIFVAMWLCLLSVEAAGQRIAVKANALSWLVTSPDIGAELVIGEKTSIGLSVFGQPFWKDYSFVAVQPEFRYWFNGRPLTRAYVGVSSFFTSYNMHMNLASRYHEGDGLAMGLSGGYVFNLGRRWGFEISGGTALFLYRQKSYSEADKANGVTSQPLEWGYSIIPSKLAATFIFIIE